MDFWNTVKKLLCSYLLVLTIFGTITSIFTSYICFRLRKNITFIFIGVESIASIFTLYFWNLNNVSQELFNFDLLNSNFWLCKIGSFYQFSSLEICAWILVIELFDEKK